MFDRYYLKSIRVGESIIHVHRPSLLYYRWALFVFVGIILLATFFLYPLQTFGFIGWVTFICLLILGVLGLVRTLIIWQLSVFVITNQRLIDKDQRGLFEKHVAECPLDKIQDIRYNKKGIVATLFNIGTVLVDSANPKGHIEIVYVPRPDVVKEHIMKAVQQHNSKNRDETQEF